MQAAARYEGGCSAQHPTVRALWEVVRSLPLDQKRAFLAFATGSDRYCCCRTLPLLPLRASSSPVNRLCCLWRAPVAEVFYRAGHAPRLRWQVVGFSGCMQIWSVAGAQTAG